MNNILIYEIFIHVQIYFNPINVYEYFFKDICCDKTVIKSKNLFFKQFPIHAKFIFIK
jgi:hypothetical protein